MKCVMDHLKSQDQIQAGGLMNNIKQTAEDISQSWLSLKINTEKKN